MRDQTLSCHETTTSRHSRTHCQNDLRVSLRHYVNKVEKKGRTQKELHEVIKWLTGYDEKELKSLIKDEVTFEDFFKKARLNPNAHLITGVICGYRVEEIEDPLIQQARYLDKLVDELAKGRKMEKILRAGE